MGSYHGEEGFRELSHAKTVFKRHRFFPIDLFYPPYGNFVQQLSLKLFLGKGDPSLQSGVPPTPARGNRP
jgi:coniferyl-aldehyde dehydrogenase